MTLTIEKAYASDFERVYPRLRASFGDRLGRDEWRKIFIDHWGAAPEGSCGLTLLKGEEVKGYLGLMFSRRKVDGREEKFCNMTSWCVSEDARTQSLPMLLHALRLKDYTITNFTASDTVAKILGRLGFTDFPLDQRVLFPAPGVRLLRRGRTCEFDPRRVRERLDESDRVLFDDHQGFGCDHLLFTSPGGYSYVILKKTRRKRLPFAKVHHLGGVEHFVECVEGSLAAVCLRLRVCGLMVDERYLRGHKLRTGVAYPHQQRGYFKTTSEALDAARIDTLYSELVVLHS